jgi:formylglycine-generating enzyme required for sulfatase activity
LPAGFVAVASAGVHESGWPIEIICIKDQSRMMLVPAGEFIMGSDSDQPNTRPARTVRLKSYYIDKYEITMAQYRRFLDLRRFENNPYREPSSAALAAATTDRHPVVGMAWRDANAYAQWAGKLLPTEAQWEKAARGSEGQPFPWGEDAPFGDRTRVRDELQRVGSFAWDISVYGCYDLAGNAWEWCRDWYDPAYYQHAPAVDPEGPKVSLPPRDHTEPERTLRGGSDSWHLVWRIPGGLSEEPAYVGFRCVLEVENVPAAPAAAAAASRPIDAPPEPRPVKLPTGGFKF